jgi:hypothetical protein
MASGDPFNIELKNHDDQDEGQGGDVAIIYLITQKDDKENSLELIITNASGDAVTFDSDNPISVAMGTLLPTDVISAIAVSPSNWTPQVNTRFGSLTLKPSSPVTLENKDALTFNLTNIFFSSKDLNSIKHTSGDFEVSYTVPERGEVPCKVLLKAPPTSQDLPLTRLDVAFIEVPSSEQWNVKVDEAGLWIDKDADTVFSNSLKDQQIRTRLVFRLSNNDYARDLHLTTASVFTVSFLPGTGFGQLADGNDLVKNVRITELSTQGASWTIDQPTDPAVAQWTLRPNSGLTLESGGGGCSFLLDAVLANTKPLDNTGGSASTEMYVFYTKVPRRDGDGDGVYEDGYLAATIEKIAPEAKALSLDIDPQKDVYDPGEQITVKWKVFGAQDLSLSYIDESGIPRNPSVREVDERSVTPPSSTYQETNASYKLMNGGVELLQRSIKVRKKT